MAARRIRLGVAATALVVFAVSGASAQAATYVPDGDGTLTVKPHKFTAGSGVGGGVMALTGVHWSRWGARTAVGNGTLEYNTCDPMCVSGNTRKVKTRIRLYRPRRGCDIWPDGVRRQSVFTKITVWVDGEAWKSLTAGTQSCQT